MWNYFKTYGDTGGHSGLVYVDSYKGDDANPGTHLLPKQTLQGGFDVISDTNARLVCAGFFKESNFIGVPTGVKILAEGYVVIDFNNINWNAVPACTFNALDTNSNVPTEVISPIDFGIFHLKNIQGFGNSAQGFGRYMFYNCILDNCFGFRKTATNAHACMWSKCVIVNGLTTLNNHVNSTIENCTFVGVEVLDNNYTGIIKNCVFSQNTKAVFGAITSSKLSHNLFLGSYPDRIIRNGVSYNDIEALQAAGFADASNLPSNTDPKFNGMNPEDLTLQPDSPLIGAGENGVTIGAYDVAVTQAADSGNWTLDFIDNTTNPQEAILAGAAVGTLTATVGIQVEATGKRMEISKILLPGSIIDPEFGETINSQLGTEGLMPSKYSIEIQYSIDGGNTYNGTWLKVPYGMRPLHDTTNDVGNADENFVNGAKIKATHILPRITLRNNDF